MNEHIEKQVEVILNMYQDRKSLERYYECLLLQRKLYTDMQSEFSSLLNYTIAAVKAKLDKTK